MPKLNTKLKMDYGLSIINTLGFVGENGENNLVYVDEPMSSSIDVDLDKVRRTKWVITSWVTNFIRVYREYAIHNQMVQNDIVAINAKYEKLGLKYADIEVINPFNYSLSETLDYPILKHNAHIALVKYHYPKLFNELMEAITDLKGSAYLESFLKSGSKYRDGESIFERSFHHYSKARESLGLVDIKLVEEV